MGRLTAPTLVHGRAGFDDYERADQRVAQGTKVPYVLIRPAALKNGLGNGKYLVFQGDGTFARPMEKEDVAAFLLNAMTSNEWNGNAGYQLAGMT